MTGRFSSLLCWILMTVTLQAQDRTKVFDPLEPLKRTIPPNILIAVDNSGSMNQDTNNHSVMDFRTGRQIWAGTGDYWHFNLPNQQWDRVPDSSLFDSANESINRTLSASPQSVTFSVADPPESVEYAAIAVDIWMPVTMDIRNAGVTITLTHDGVSATIRPVSQWFAFRKSDGDPNGYDEICCDGSRRCDDDERCRRYRVMYAFPDFAETDPSGPWTLSVHTTGGETLTWDAAYLSLRAIPTKMTVLKTVLQRLIQTDSGIRLALGTYKTNWVRPYYYYNYLFDPQGIFWSGSYYLWWVDSGNPGFSLCSGWPSDPLESRINRDALLEWVDLAESGPDDFDSSADETREIMARGYTPIQSCLEDIRDGLAGANSTLSSLSYNHDPYQSCRQYAVIFLTDGMCTESGCSNDTIREIIKDIYHAHEINYGISDTVGTRTYVIGLSLTDAERETLDEWADAGDDGIVNGSRSAYMPSNSRELMQALGQAIYEASAQQVAINSDVIFGTVDPDKAAAYNPLFGSKTVSIGSGSETVHYPAVAGNIMFTTLMYYPTWEGTVRAFQPMYRRTTTGTGNDESNLYYFPNGSYPMLWDAHDMLATRLNGETDDTGTHLNGIRDALGLTDQIPSSSDGPDWRDIRMVDPADGRTVIRLNQFTFDPEINRWRPDPVIASRVASALFNGDIRRAEQFIIFLQTRQLADITNSTPALVNEPEMGFEEWSESYFNFKIAMRAARIPIVVVGANDGMLHAFNAYTGREVWTVLPVVTQAGTVSMFENWQPGTNPSGQPDIGSTDYLGRTAHFYGVASSPKVADINRTPGTESETWGTILVCGAGAGGHGYVALDITSTLDPVPMWDTTLSRDYEDMGESWSYPALWQILVDGRSATDTPHGVPAGIFTSGPSPDTSQGKEIYLVNLNDGSLMHRVQASDIPSDAFLMAAPAGILDMNQQFLKGAYVADTRGGVYRYTAGGECCKVYQTPNRTWILSTPAVYIDENKTEWIAFGEMGTEDPARNIFSRNSTIYSFKVPSCSSTKNLLDISSMVTGTNLNTTFPLGGNDGFLFGLDTNEILFTNPLVTRYYYEDGNGVMQTQTVSVFITYRYPDTGDACGTGTAQMYMFGVTDLFVADPEEDGSAATVVGEGRPGNPVKTGITGTIWINTETGPVRILPADDRVEAAVVPIYFPFSGADARKLGAGAWLVK